MDMDRWQFQAVDDSRQAEKATAQNCLSVRRCIGRVKWSVSDGALGVSDGDFGVWSDEYQTYRCKGWWRQVCQMVVTGVRWW